MPRPFLTKAIAFAIAALPIAVIMAGVTIVENLRNPQVPPLSDQDWEIRFMAVEVFVIAYIVGFVYALPFFAFFRWMAGRLGWLNYATAIAAGTFTAFTFPIQGIVFGRLGQGSLTQTFLIFLAAGATSGALYWWCERRFTRPQDIGFEKGLTT